MDLNVEQDNPDGIQPVVENVETVEVVSGSEGVLSPPGADSASKMTAPSQLSVPSSGMIEIDPHALTCTLVEMANQQLAQGNAMLPSSIAATLPGTVMSSVGDSPLVTGMKRQSMNDGMGGDYMDELPRKKSRNYLDSHKTIEKKRRDRINTGLSLLKEMVPDCRQYGSKKLDKAEVIECTIQYLKRMQAHCNERTGDIDIAVSHRDWCNDLMTWVFQNKLLFSGPTALEQFCNALLLHLQSCGNPPLSSPSNVLLNQAASGSASDDETLLRNQAAILQQLVTSIGNQGNDSSSNTPNQQQIAQIQALLLLQQQQQNTEGGGASNGTPPDENSTQQLQQLQQLQAFLLQHIASESGQTKPATDEEVDVVYSQSTEANTNHSLMVGGSGISDAAVTIASASGVDLNLSSAITSAPDQLDPTPIYSSTSLDDNLLDSGDGVRSASQMWSDQQGSSLLLGDGVQEHSIESEGVQEEVELLSSGQQDQ